MSNYTIIISPEAAYYFCPTRENKNKLLKSRFARRRRESRIRAIRRMYKKYINLQDYQCDILSAL